MKNFITILFLLLFFYGCKIHSTVKEKKPQELLISDKIINLDEIIIYKLPSSSEYFTGIKCEEIKNMDEAIKISIIDKKEIIDFYKIFDNNNYFNCDTSFHSIDSRMSIEFISENKVVKQICWSEVKMIQKDGKIYRYSKEIENFLLSKKLIGVIRF